MVTNIVHDTLIRERHQTMKPDSEQITCHKLHILCVVLRVGRKHCVCVTSENAKHALAFGQFNSAILRLYVIAGKS